MRSRLALHVLLLFLALTGCYVLSAAAAGSAWRRVPGWGGSAWATNVPGGYLASFKARSRVECVVQCKKYNHCYAVAFNATTGTCYLQPGSSSSSGAAPAGQQLLGKVYLDKDSKCTPDKAPESNGKVTWSHTRTSLSGKVTCDEDFVNTTANVTVQCPAHGSWQTGGMCARHVWTNLNGWAHYVGIPVTVIDGWSVCVEGIPVKNTWFTMDLTSGSNILLQLSVDVVSNSISVTSRISGIWMSGAKQVQQTIEVGKLLRLKATHSQGQYKLYAQGKLLESYTSSAPSQVEIFSDKVFQVTRLDVWCFE